jgi:hypothetical protein
MSLVSLSEKRKEKKLINNSTPQNEYNQSVLKAKAKKSRS